MDTSRGGSLWNTRGEGVVSGPGREVVGGGPAPRWGVSDLHVYQSTCVGGVARMISGWPGLGPAPLRLLQGMQRTAVLST